MASANQAQKKHLLERIDRTRRYHDVEIKEPASVAAARKIVDTWEEKRRKEKAKHWDKVRADCEKAREAVLFSDATEALRAVSSLEKKYKPSFD